MTVISRKTQVMMVTFTKSRLEIVIMDEKKKELKLV